MDKLLDGIRRFQADVFAPRHHFFGRLAAGQHPEALFITCSDSRVAPDLICQADPGDLFVLRNAGNLVPPHGAAPAGGEAATIEYAVEALGVRDVVVCGHTRCGAVKALLHPEQLDGLPGLRPWLGHAEATRRVVRDRCGHCGGNDLWDAAVEANVRVQLENLRTHPAIAAGLARGELALHGWVYHLETGEVTTWDAAAGRFVPVVDEPAGDEVSVPRLLGQGA